MVSTAGNGVAVVAGPDGKYSPKVSHVIECAQNNIQNSNFFL